MTVGQFARNPAFHRVPKISRSCRRSAATAEFAASPRSNSFDGKLRLKMKFGDNTHPGNREKRERLSLLCASLADNFGLGSASQ